MSNQNQQIKTELDLRSGDIMSFNESKKSGKGKKQYYFFPEEIDDIINRFQAVYKESFEIRRGKWEDGFSRLNKEEIVWIMLLDSLPNLESRIEKIEAFIESQNTVSK